MKKARFSDEQIVRILREVDRDPVAEVAKRHAVSVRRYMRGANGLAIWAPMMSNGCAVWSRRTDG